MLLNELEKHGLHDRIKAIGHRIAHGGENITSPSSSTKTSSTN